MSQLVQVEIQVLLCLVSKEFFSKEIFASQREWLYCFLIKCGKSRMKEKENIFFVFVRKVELKSNQVFRPSSEELKKTENRLSISRKQSESKIFP